MHGNACVLRLLGAMRSGVNLALLSLEELRDFVLVVTAAFGLWLFSVIMYCSKVWNRVLFLIARDSKCGGLQVKGDLLYLLESLIIFSFCIEKSPDICSNNAALFYLFVVKSNTSKFSFKLVASSHTLLMCQ